jgi:hypothetical protein
MEQRCHFVTCGTKVCTWNQTESTTHLPRRNDLPLAKERSSRLWNESSGDATRKRMLSCLRSENYNVNVASHSLFIWQCYYWKTYPFLSLNLFLSHLWHYACIYCQHQIKVNNRENTIYTKQGHHHCHEQHRLQLLIFFQVLIIAKAWPSPSSTDH